MYAQLLSAWTGRLGKRLGSAIAQDSVDIANRSLSNSKYPPKPRLTPHRDHDEDRPLLAPGEKSCPASSAGHCPSFPTASVVPFPAKHLLLILPAHSFRSSLQPVGLLQPGPRNQRPGAVPVRSRRTPPIGCRGGAYSVGATGGEPHGRDSEACGRRKRNALTTVNRVPFFRGTELDLVVRTTCHAFCGLEFLGLGF